MSADAGSSATRAGASTAADPDGAHARSAGDRWSDHDTRTTTGDVRHDRIRWGAVWTGVLTTISLYIVLQLLFNALGWLDLGNEGSGTTRAVVSGVLALVAFFLGGMAAGASALWRRANDGMINAVVTWAATVVALLLLAVLGGGALAGSLADVVAQNVDAQGATAGIDPAQAAETARQSAGWAALALGLTVVASALGGSIGAKMWPGKGERAADRR